MPERIQLRRTRGWRLPAGAVVVARPTRWGNPVHLGAVVVDPGSGEVHVVTRDEAAAEYERQLRQRLLRVTEQDVRRELAGHDLACWCHLDEACHADVLLRIANGDP